MRLGLGLLLVIATAVPARAHDFFIEPSKFRVARGESMTATLYVGAKDELDEIPRNDRKIVRFEAHLGDAVVPVEGKHGHSPAGRIAFDTPGVATLVFQSTHSYVELEPAKFGAYLVEEGLDDVAAERARLGLDPIPGRESYARYVKALITVGDGSAGFDRKVGLPFEIVALTDPRAGGTAKFQVLFDGRPRANALVDVLRADLAAKHVVEVLRGRTDDAGVVTFAIPSDGRWIVATTAMRKAPPELQLEGEWESFWTSLTFEAGRPAKAKRGCAASDPALFTVLGLLTLLLARKTFRARRDS